MPSVEDWWLAEYREVRREWEVRTSHEQQLVNYSLVVLAAALTFLGVGPFRELGAWQAPIAFALASVFLALGFFYLRHDVFLAYSGQFVAECLGPALRNRYGGSPVLGWDIYLLKRHGTGWKKWVGQLAAVSVCVFPIMGPGIGLWAFGLICLTSGASCDAPLTELWEQALIWVSVVAASALVLLDGAMLFICFRERVMTHSRAAAALQTAQPGGSTSESLPFKTISACSRTPAPGMPGAAYEAVRTDGRTGFSVADRAGPSQAALRR